MIPPPAYGAVVVSSIILFGFAGMAYLVFAHPMPAGTDNTLANVLLGALSTMASQVANYWLGSSVGSKQKTALLAARGPEG